MNPFISDALAQQAGGPPPGADITGIFMIIGMFVLLYFLMIRPQVKRQKEHKKMVESLAKGDEVTTIGGIAGRITELGENFAKVEISDGVEVKIRRHAVEAVLPKGSIQEL